MIAPATGRVLVLFGATLCFAAFAAGVRLHFDARRGMRAGMQGISAVSLVGILALWLKLARHPASTLWWLAIVLLALSLGLFLWSVRSSPRARLPLAWDGGEPDFVLRTGVYARIRHPFYTSYMIFWSGLAFARLDWFGWIFGAGMCLLYLSTAIGEERQFAASAMARSYAAYRARTGMFLPRLGYFPGIGETGSCPPG